MAAIQKRSLVDQVYEALRGDIITLRRPLGSRLNVSELQEELGVSCTPIREALNRLQQEGLVVYENNVGARILEHGDRTEMEAELARYLEDYRRAKSVQSEVTAVNRFVGTFYHHCGNRRLDKSMLSIQGQQLLLRYLYANCLTQRGSNAEDFESMLTATRAGDAEGICAALQANTDRRIPVLLDHVARERAGQ